MSRWIASSFSTELLACLQAFPNLNKLKKPCKIAKNFFLHIDGSQNQKIGMESEQCVENGPVYHLNNVNSKLNLLKLENLLKIETSKLEVDPPD